MKGESPISKTLNRVIRVEKRVSQTEIAKKLNVTFMSVNRWLNGGSIELDKIVPLCELLKITPDELFGFTSSLEEKDKLYNAYKESKHKDAINELLKK